MQIKDEYKNSEEIEKLMERRALKPETAKKVLVVAIIIFVILCVVGVLKWNGMI